MNKLHKKITGRLLACIVRIQNETTDCDLCVDLYVCLFVYTICTVCVSVCRHISGHVLYVKPHSHRGDEPPETMYSNIDINLI